MSRLNVVYLFQQIVSSVNFMSLKIVGVFKETRLGNNERWRYGWTPLVTGQEIGILKQESSYDIVT